ncbi:MAG: hypothetical protein ACYCVE_04180 [Gemmatimonadaceae bacterium]
MTALAPANVFGASVACDSTSCKDDWDRAQLWIVNHSKYKIQTATDVLVETFNPSDDAPNYGFTATKEPQGSGHYVIALALTSGNMLGCDPKPRDVQRAFLFYVQTGRDLLAGMNGLSGIR